MTLADSPGPAARRTFSLGLRLTMVVMLAAIGFGYWLDLLTVRDVVLSLLLAVPVAYVLASCLLSVWLGFDRRIPDSWHRTS